MQRYERKKAEKQWSKLPSQELEKEQELKKKKKSRRKEILNMIKRSNKLRNIQRGN